MFLLDFFLSEDKKIERHTRRLTNRDSQPEDREGSALWLSQNAGERGIMGLLARFDMALEHQMKDSTERDRVFGLLVEKGSAVIEPTKRWLRTCKQFALPLRLLGEVGGQEAAVAMAFELLDIERKKDDFKPDKKKGLLLWLAEIKNTPAAVEHAAPFLVDFDEGVRYAAVEVLLTQGTDSAREELQRVFTNDREDSNRLKIRVAEQFIARGWKAESKVEAGLPGGFAFRDGRIVQG